MGLKVRLERAKTKFPPVRLRGFDEPPPLMIVMRGYLEASGVAGGFMIINASCPRWGDMAWNSSSTPCGQSRGFP